MNRAPFLVLAVCLGLIAAGRIAHADDAGGSAPATATFLKVPIFVEPGRYVPSTDVNVRAEPKTTAKKVETLTRGERVSVAGRAKSDKNWLAVLKDGKPKGFVYGDIMLPLIDGALSQPITSEVSSSDSGTCRYTIKFDGKAPVEDGLFNVADYTVSFQCDGAEKALTFSTPMFLTEAPYRLKPKPEYQITIDLEDIPDVEEQVLSSTSIYNTDTDTVRFDGVTSTTYGDGPSKKGHPVADVPEALKTAVDLAVQAWNGKLWTALGKQQD